MRQSKRKYEFHYHLDADELWKDEYSRSILEFCSVKNPFIASTTSIFHKFHGTCRINLIYWRDTGSQHFWNYSHPLLHLVFKGVSILVKGVPSVSRRMFSGNALSRSVHTETLSMLGQPWFTPAGPNSLYRWIDQASFLLLVITSISSILSKSKFCIFSCINFSSICTYMNMLGNDWILLFYFVHLLLYKLISRCSGNVYWRFLYSLLQSGILGVSLLGYLPLNLL